MLTDFGFPPASPTAGPPLSELLSDPEHLELGLTTVLMKHNMEAMKGRAEAAELKRLSWEALGEEALRPHYARLAARQGHAFPADLRLRDLSEAVARADEAGRRLLEADGASPMRVTLEQSEGRARDRVQIALSAMATTALADAGWEVSRLPLGGPLACNLHGSRLEPQREVQDLLRGEGSGEEWRRLTEREGSGRAPPGAAGLELGGDCPASSA